MATIRRRPSGSYQAQISINGVRRAKSFKRRSDARHWAATIESDLKSGVPTEARKPTREFLIQYRQEVTERRAHPRHMRAVIGCFLEDPIADIPIIDVTSKDVEAWIERRRTIPSRSTGHIVEESTIARQLQTLSAFFSWAVRLNYCAENPCFKVERPRSNPPRERVASDADLEAIQYVAGWTEGTVPQNKLQRVAAAFLLSCLTGMRAGEMMRIERSWIHDRTLVLPAEATKTATSREIALCDRAKRILDDVCSLGFEPAIWNLTDASRDALWRRIRDKAGLTDQYDKQGRLIEQGLTFHDGRATFATWAASPGPDGAPRLDVMSLARQTGHKDLRMLMRYYRPNIESFAKRLNG